MSNSKVSDDGNQCEKWWMPKDFNGHTSLKIWRYMDLAKYLSFLQTSSIRLSRADKFEDPYEGLYNGPTIQAMANMVPTPGTYDHAHSFARQLEEDRQSTYINCWHWNDRESAAMWKLYSNNDYCVAISSDVGKLLDQLPRFVAFTFVNYVDWDHDRFQAGNMSQSPFFHKRKEFVHENEVRVVYMQPLHGQRGGPELEPNETGFLLPVTVSELISEVVLAPSTPKWVAEMVIEATRRFGCDIPVRTSTLLASPR